MLLQTVTEVVYFAPEVHFKSANVCRQTERQIQQDAWGSGHIARVSQQCLQENCPQMLENEQWPSNNSEFEWNGNILKPSFEIQNSF